MKFHDAIDLYIADMRAEGKLNSAVSERGYRGTLNVHADDVANRDPRYVGREDVQRTLAHWPHPSTRSVNRAKLVSFYDWGDAGGPPERQSGSPDSAISSWAESEVPPDASRGRCFSQSRIGGA